MDTGGFIASRYVPIKNGYDRGVDVLEIRDGDVCYSVDGIFTFVPTHMPADEFRAWMADGYTPAEARR